MRVDMAIEMFGLVWVALGDGGWMRPVFAIVFQAEIKARFDSVETKIQSPVLQPPNSQMCAGEELG